MRQKRGIFIPPGRTVWPHEMRVAKILSRTGHYVEFLAEQKNIPTADIKLDGIEFEIKSPLTNKPDKLERNIKRGIKQSPNIIFDSSRIRNTRDDNLRRFLVDKARQQKQIGQLIFITKRGQVIDIKALI